MALSKDQLVALKQKLSAVLLSNLQNNITAEQLDNIWTNLTDKQKLVLAKSFIHRNTEGTDLLVSTLTKNFQAIADAQADDIIKAGSVSLDVLLLVLTG